jgi:hypothetical protein
VDVVDICSGCRQPEEKGDHKKHGIDEVIEKWTSETCTETRTTDAYGELKFSSPKKFYSKKAKVKIFSFIFDSSSNLIVPYIVH